VNTMKQCINDFKTAYDSVQREVLYDVLIELRISMKLLQLVKSCLDETYSTVQECKHLSNIFPIINGFKQGNALSPLLLSMPPGEFR